MWNFKKLLDFSDKTVIITGGAGLLGRVYAVALLQTGAKVILFDKKIDKKKLLDKIKTESNIEQNKLNNLRVIKCDITNPKKEQRFLKNLINYYII